MSRQEAVNVTRRPLGLHKLHGNTQRKKIERNLFVKEINQLVSLLEHSFFLNSIAPHRYHDNYFFFKNWTPSKTSILTCSNFK